MTQITIVINTLQRRHQLSKLMAALELQRHQDFEIIIVKGPSTDGTDEFCATLSKDVKILNCPTRNLSQSRNIGVSEAAGEIIAFIDDDAIPEPNWLERIDLAFRDKSVGVFGGALRETKGFYYQARVSACDRFGKAYRFDTERSALKRGCVNTRPQADRFLSPTGANSAFRRSALIEVGGFDEFFWYFLEETDATIRVLEAGYKCKYDEDCEVIHNFAPSYVRDDRRVPKTVYPEVRSQIFFVRKHATGHYGEHEIAHAIDEIERKHIERIKTLFLAELISATDFDRLKSEITRAKKESLSESTRREHHLKTGPRPCFQRFATSVAPFKRLKLAMICRYFSVEKPGGIAVWSKCVAEGLSRIGHEVTVIHQSHTHQHIIEFRDGFWVHGIPTANRLDGPAPGVPDDVWNWSASARDEALRVHYLRGIDIVSAPIWDCEGIAISRSGWLPLCTSMHTTYSLALPSKPEWSRNEKYLRKHVMPMIDLERELMQSSTVVLANSQAIMNDFAVSSECNVPSDRLKVIPHGIAPTKSQSKKHSEFVDVIFVGRLEKRKGVDIAVDVFEQLLKANTFIRIQLAGDINSTDEVGAKALEKARRLESKNPSRFRVLGYIDDKQLTSLYENSHILLAPSRYESFGLIYIEAMRAGCIPIGLAVGGVPEVIEHNVNGFIMPSDDPRMISEEILKLANNRTQIDLLAEAAIKSHSARFTLEKMSRDIAESFLAASRQAES